MSKHSVSELAKLLNVSTVTVRNYIKTGKLKASKIKQGLKHYYVIDSEDLEDFKNKYLN